MGSEADVTYMSVKEAIREQELARRYNTMTRPNQVKLPPTWSELHAKTGSQYMIGRSNAAARSPSKVGFPRAEDGLTLTASVTSSVGKGAMQPPSSPGALGGSSKSGLNHTSTYHYGEAPTYPALASGNQYNSVGSYTMFGSQVRSAPHHLILLQPSSACLSPAAALASRFSLMPLPAHVLRRRFPIGCRQAPLDLALRHASRCCGRTYLRRI